MKRRHLDSTRSTASALYVVRLLLTTSLYLYAGYLAYRFITQPRYLLPDQLFVILLLFVLGFQKGRRLRLFLIDWLPFIVFIILYNMMRSLAPRLYGRVHVIEPYQWELTTFGWMANGDIPAFALQTWRAAHAGEALMIATDIVLGTAYVMFFIVPIVLMVIFWWKLKDRRLFWRFSCTINLHNFMALATFVLYPAAPPWYFQKFGAIQPTETVYGQVAAGGLVHLDEIFNMGLFATVWGSFNPNYFAAVPSLHAAWPVAVAMFTMIAFGRKAWPVMVYPALVIVGGVYLNHHYVVDYVISWAYLLVAFVVVERAIMPRLDRVMDYQLLRANGVLSGSTTTDARRRGPAKSDQGESPLAKVLRIINSISDAVSTGPVGQKKAIKYFAIFIAICLPLVILSYNLFGGLGDAGIRYTQGDYLQRQGRQEDAIAKFDEAIQLDPLHVGAYNNRGNAYQKLGQHERAIQDYDEAIQLNTQNALSYINRGAAYFSLGQHQRAIQDYDEAIRLDPQLAEAYINRGGAYFSLGQNERAIKEYDAGIRLDPQVTKAYVARGNAYFNLGQYQRAIKEFDAGIRLDPQRTKAYLGRGNAYFNLEQYQRAIQNYDIAISLNLRYALAYSNRAIAFARLGQAADAKADQTRACQLDKQYC